MNSQQSSRSRSRISCTSSARTPSGVDGESGASSPAWSRRATPRPVNNRPADARKYAAKVCDDILALIDENLIPSASGGVPKVFYNKTDVLVPRVMEEQASKLGGSCAAQAPEWEELQRLRAEGLVAVRDTNKLLNDFDELISEWFNVVKGVVDSEDLLLNTTSLNHENAG